MHVGQRQHYDIPVQAVDLQSQGSSTEVPPPTVVYPHLSPVVATKIIVFTRPVGNRPMFGLCLVVALYQHLMSLPTLVI